MLAKNIEMYLKQNGIKQSWLAEKLNVSKSTLHGILKGNTQMKADMFIHICQLLRVPPETFTEKEE